MKDSEQSKALEFKLFRPYFELRYGLSEKPDGSMKLSAGGENVASRQNYFSRLGIRDIVSAGIAHSDSVSRVTSQDSGEAVAGADGLVTADTDVFLSVTVADCLPVYFYDPVTGVAGLAHAGWRGILAGIIPNTIRTMVKAGAKAASILCATGPGIQAHHFEVGGDVAAKFRQYAECVSPGAAITIDLPGVVARQAFELGVARDNIEKCRECTYCLRDKYFSFRRDMPAAVEAMAAYIGVTRKKPQD